MGQPKGATPWNKGKRLPFKKERRVWSLMKHRCLCQTSSDYINYGGRGIKVCERWLIFENFFNDMGPIPFEGATIERKDVNGPYDLINCCWVTLAAQANNKRNTHWIEVNGEKLSTAEAARRYPVKYSTIKERLRRGWTSERAVGIDG